MPAPLEKFNATTIICRGGLDSNRNWLQMNLSNPGTATTLINFEPSLFGGYRRINGYQYLEDTDSGEVDPTGAEGAILGVFIFDDKIIAARKQQGSAIYSFYLWVDGASWSEYATGLTLTSTGVTRIRYATFNFDGVRKIIFVDGVNNATLFDGTTWNNIDPVGTGADYANAGGANALAAPKYVSVFRNHIFMSGDSTDPHVVAHSAPNEEFDWTTAGGAGQINGGLNVVQLQPFRDELFVFGFNRIKKIVVDSAGDFVRQDVTDKVGCIASDSVVEINGDLVFLGPDGIRPVKATERVNDIEIASISKNIQQDLLDLIEEHTSTDISAVVVNAKSQFRLFFSESGGHIAGESHAILGSIRGYPEGQVWEFSLLQGFEVACCTSGYISENPSSEYVLHGGHDGKVYRQEIGNSFNGTDIYAQYSMPYLDFGTPAQRKTPHKIYVFTRPEGAVTLDTELNFDWGTSSSINPTSFTTMTEGNPAIYGTAIYGTDTYDGTTVPTMMTNVNGSGRSFRIQFSTEGQTAPYSIQAVVIVYELDGYK